MFSVQPTPDGAAQGARLETRHVDRACVVRGTGDAFIPQPGMRDRHGTGGPR